MGEPFSKTQPERASIRLDMEQTMMTTAPAPPRLSRLQKLVTRGFQRYWRMSRGLKLRAEALIWDEDHRLLVTSDTRLPGALVGEGQSAEAALKAHLETSFDTWPREADPLLIAMVLASGPQLLRTSTHIALFECDVRTPITRESTHTFIEPEALAGTLGPEILTIIRRRAAERRGTKPV